MLFRSLLILVVGLATAKVSVKILSIRKEAIWMAVLLLCVIGSYALNKSYFDVIVMFAAGCLGFVFRRMEFPLGPLILGLLLGDICETNMRRAMSLSMGDYGIFVQSPLSIVMLAAIVLVLFWPLVGGKVKGMFKKKPDPV